MSCHKRVLNVTACHVLQKSPACHITKRALYVMLRKSPTFHVTKEPFVPYHKRALLSMLNKSPALYTDIHI